MRRRGATRAIVRTSVRIEQSESLRQAPTEVHISAGIRGLSKIDLLSTVLADVADIEVPSGAIKREAPGIAQTKTPHLRSPAGEYKGITGDTRARVAGNGRSE